MTIKTEVHDYWSLKEMCWSGALPVLEECERQCKTDDLMSLLEELFWEGASDVEVNDFIWFDASDYLHLYEEDEEYNEEEDY